jgi:hypothetical protein
MKPHIVKLFASIGDAVRKTGIDGFMVDWVWMPNRASTTNKWLECEKKFYPARSNETNRNKS